MKKTGLMLLIYLLGVSVALAVRVTSLYQGVLPVASQAEAERDLLANQALAQVFVKVSGNRTVLNNPTVKAHLSSGSSLIGEFSYVHAPEMPGNTKPYLLQLNFDPEGINKILREAGAPIWGQNRPLLLVWLDQEVPGHAPEMIGADSNSAIPVLLKQNTDRRGIPVMFPAMDVEDLGHVSVNDIVSMNFSKLLTASQRYSSDAILTGRIVQTSNGYEANWKLLLGNDQWGFIITGKTLPDVLAALADHVADALAARFATVIASTVQSELTLDIQGVTEAEDYVQVTNYLKHLTPVSDVELVQVTGNDMILKVSLRGSRESFAQAISVGQKLIPVSQDKTRSMAIYQWNQKAP